MLWLGRQTIFFWTFVALVGFIFLMEIGLAVLKPELGFSLNLPWFAILKHAALAYVSSFILIVIHTWVGLKWHNFVVAVSVGISMTVIGLLLINDPDWAKYYPWTMPGMILNRAVKGIPIITELLMIGIGSVIIAVIGGWTFTRSDVL